MGIMYTVAHHHMASALLQVALLVVLLRLAPTLTWWLNTQGVRRILTTSVGDMSDYAPKAAVM